MAKQKFYVVWKGRTPGIYDTWEACREQVMAYPSAQYKSFERREEAESAYLSAPEPMRKAAKRPSGTARTLIGKALPESISVDGAWNTATGVAEYQGVYTKTGELLFHQGPFEDGTNNIVEFLAIVHALGYCKKHKLAHPIYSDSRNAIGWVKKKKCGTKHPRSNRNKPLFELVDRAEAWLQTSTYTNEVLKWETKAWGENPADFGRK